MKKLDSILPFRLSAMDLSVAADGSCVCGQVPGRCDAVVLIVSGGGVGSRAYDSSDPIVRRIASSPDLYVSVHGGSVMDYVRKSVVDSAVEGCSLRIIGVVVCRDAKSVNTEAEVRALRCKRLSLSALRKDIPLADYLASRLLKRILLPVLLGYLVVLLANFLIHSCLTDRLGELRSASARESVEAKRRSALSQAQERLFDEFRTVPRANLSVLSDRIASLLPEDVRLTSMSFANRQAGVCGEAFSSEAVMGFVDSLRESLGCGAVNVLMLEKDRREDLFRFEIQIML